MGICIAFLVITLTLGILGKLSETTHTVFGNTYRFDARGLPHPVDTAENKQEPPQ